MLGSKLKPPASSHIPHAGYAGVVVALASFLLLFFLFPDPIRSYVARVVVEQQAEGNATSIQMPLPMQRETALRLAESCLPQTTTASGEADCVTLQLPLVQAKVTHSSDQATRLELECRARHAAQALALCQRIAEELVQTQPEDWQPLAELRRTQADDLTRRLALVKDSERSVADELLQLEKERLRTALETMERLPTPVATEPRPTPTIDPQWTQLQQQIAQLNGQKDELLRTKTEAHPLVQDVEERLAQLKSSLAVRRPQMIQNPTLAPRYASSPLLEVQSAMQAHEQKRNALTEQHTELRGRIEQLEHDLQRLQQPAPALALQTKIALPSTIVEREGGHPSTLKLLAFCLAATTAGGLVFMLVRQVRRQRVFHSWAQVREELQLEVLGTASALSNDSNRGTRAEFCLRNSVLMAELVVFVLAITLTYAMSMQPQLTQPPLHDPWGAMAEALDRVGEQTVRR